NLIYEERPELKGKLNAAYCPERVLPGNVMYELVHNDRVIGGIDEKSTTKAIDFYKQFIKGGLHETNARTAEMCKLVENSSRDVQIAFA
ncbi:UDP-N-acetyl-D-mannosamine dehydrogenase, partial [Aquimarina celericrescens]|nr:UDP-N-acetyl-D-mannosamine dehydrogenase [Aquimarina celericrescens]